MPTQTLIKIPPTRAEYVTRLWETDIMLKFCGDHLHIDEKVFNWKTGEKLDEEYKKQNQHLTKPLIDRVLATLEHIQKEYLKENS